VATCMDSTEVQPHQVIPGEVEDRGQTDRFMCVTILSNPTLTLTLDLDFSPQGAVVMTHTQTKFKVRGQVVQKLGQKWTDTTDFITFLVNTVCNHNLVNDHK